VNKKVEELLQNLASLKVQLRPSKVHGIGVFAITAITKNERNLFSNDKNPWLKVPTTETDKLPKHVRAVITNYCLYDEKHYYIPQRAFKVVDLVMFINHSDRPNIKSINDGEDFIALRNIKANEELFVDYGTIV
jgi:SET domain-containing protein